MSIKIPSKVVNIDGVNYTLRCNMAVLDRLQDGQDGDIGVLMEKPSYQAIFLILKAMLDDYCEDAGLDEVPMRRLKKLYSPADVAGWGVFRMFVDSMTVFPAGNTVSDPDTGTKSGPPENSGN